MNKIEVAGIPELEVERVQRSLTLANAVTAKSRVRPFFVTLRRYIRRASSDPAPRIRTRSQARAELVAIAPAPEPAPVPVAKAPKKRSRAKSSGANQPKAPAAVAVKGRARTKSTPTDQVAPQADPAPARRVTRAATVAAKSAEVTATVVQPTPAPNLAQTPAVRATAAKRQPGLRERVTIAAAAANGDIPVARSRTLSMTEKVRQDRARTPTPPCDGPQTAPALKTPTHGSITASTDSTNVESSLGSTPMGQSTANCADNATLDILKAAFKQEIDENIERTDDSFVRDLYQDLASDAKIRAAFKKLGYDVAAIYKEDGLPGCWTDLPEDPTHEWQLYGPFGKVFKAILTHLAPKDKRSTRKIEDTSQVHFQHSDNTNHTTKPDFTVVATGYSFELPHVKNSIASDKIGYTNAASVFDGKKNKSRGHSTAHIQQMGLYSRQIMIQQPNRKFVRTMIFTEHAVRLVHFDRSGAKYSPWINIHRDPYTFVRLVLGLSSPNEEILGLDTSVQWTIKKGRKVAGTIKMVDSEGQDHTYDLLDVHPVFIRAALRGRGTTCWHAHERGTAPDEAVLIKDAWRSEGRASEHILLEDIKGINGVTHMLCYRDYRAETKHLRGTHLVSKGKFHNRVWLRIVLKQYGRSLRHFTSQLQAISALRDTLYAHCKLYEEKSVLHRDISMQNILLGKPDAFPGTRGILIDFDMAVKIGPRPAASIQVDCRTGTRLYQSLSVLDSYTVGSTATAHDYLDDLESYLYSLSHLTYGWAEPGQEIVPRPTLLRHWDNDVPDIAMQLKKLFIVSDIDFDGVSPFWGAACRELLESFHDYMGDLVREKLRIIKLADPVARLERLQRLHANRKEHYDTVKGFFDKAIARLEQDPESVPRGLSLFSGSSSTPRISNKRASESNDDDVDDTPSKRNRTIGYRGSRFSKPLDIENETVRD